MNLTWLTVLFSRNPVAWLVGIGLGAAALALLFMLWSANTTIKTLNDQLTITRGQVVSLARNNAELEVSLRRQNLSIVEQAHAAQVRISASEAALKRALVARAAVEARVTALLNAPVHADPGAACFAADARLLELE